MMPLLSVLVVPVSGQLLVWQRPGLTQHVYQNFSQQEVILWLPREVSMLHSGSMLLMNDTYPKSNNGG